MSFLMTAIVDDCVDSEREAKRSMRKRSGNRSGKLVVVSTNVQSRRLGATLNWSSTYIWDILREVRGYEENSS